MRSLRDSREASPLALRARAELERRRRARVQREGLLDFVPRITPRWASPEHLGAFVELIERASRERVRALVSVPPRHGKTELVLHAIAWMLARYPDRTNAYASYAAPLTRSKSRLARDYAIAAGVRLRDDAAALNEWRTTAGGGLLATGVGGPLTGFGVDGIMFVDDPHKNRADAESPAKREMVHGWWTSTAASRLEPGSSAIVVHTRWHPDDLIGRLTEDDEAVGWEVLNLPAIAEMDEPLTGRVAGESLWPERWPADALALREVEVGPYDWASLYQGRPRPRGGAVFGDVHLYEALPCSYRVSIGIDLAYTERTSSDYSVAVVMAESGGVYYVLKVVRLQVAAPAFAERLKALKVEYPTARLFGYVGGVERGVLDLMRTAGVSVGSEPAVADKFVRAQGTAASWNAGKVLLPANAPPWADAFVSELRSFTGVKDRRDDQVDALVAAHDALSRSIASPSSFNKYRSALPKLRA